MVFMVEGILTNLEFAVYSTRLVRFGNGKISRTIRKVLPKCECA